MWGKKYALPRPFHSLSLPAIRVSMLRLAALAALAAQATQATQAMLRLVKVKLAPAHL